MTSANAMDGVHTHTSSFARMARPRAVKNRRGFERRDENGPPREEVALVHERRGERHPSSSGRHCIEHAVRRRGEKEIEPHQSSLARAVSPEREQADAREQRGEDEGMRESTMPEHAVVRDADPVADDIQIRNCRTGGAEQPKPGGPQGPRKGGSDRESRDRVRECGGHVRALLRPERFRDLTGRSTRARRTRQCRSCRPAGTHRLHDRTA
jgi:hypothetical protein